MELFAVEEQATHHLGDLKGLARPTGSGRAATGAAARRTTSTRSWVASLASARADGGPRAGRAA
jgi:hypothetical protein